MITPLVFLSLVEQAMRETLPDGDWTFQRYVDFAGSSGALEIESDTADQQAVVTVRADAEAQEPCIRAAFRMKNEDQVRETIFAATGPRASNEVWEAARGWTNMIATRNGSIRKPIPAATAPRKKSPRMAP